MRHFSRKTALAGALLAALVTGSAQADTKAGVDAWSRGDHEAAVKEWLGPAAKGDAEKGVQS